MGLYVSSKVIEDNWSPQAYFLLRGKSIDNALNLLPLLTNTSSARLSKNHSLQSSFTKSL